MNSALRLALLNRMSGLVCEENKAQFIAIEKIKKTIKQELNTNKD